MAFVYETMSLENWKELVRLNPSGMYPSGIRDHWVVDHENDVQFISLGGQGGMPSNSDYMPNFYVLLWHKNIVRIEARHTSEIDGNNKIIKQEVISIYAPKVLEPEVEAIRTAIPQALLANWRGVSPFNVQAVQVSLSAVNFV